MRRDRLAFVLVSLLATPLARTATADDWPQWRGPNRDGISRETGLLKQWPEGGPKLRWTVDEIGTGYSSPSIVGGRVFLQTTRDDEEFAMALDEESGSVLWSVPIGKVGRNRGPQYPGTRSTPTFDEGRVYCLASDGELVCLIAETGDLVWQRHYRKDFEGQPGSWAFAESILIDGDLAICTPGGGEAMLAALDKTTGDVVWQSKLPGDKDNAEYASIMPVEVGGVKQYVQYLRSGVVGVNAETGEFLWRYDRTTSARGANILTPVVDGNRVFTSGSRQGGATVELTAEGDDVTSKELYFDQKLATGIGGAVLIDGYLYATSRAALFCADFSTGEIKWQERGVSAGSVCYADGRLYVRGHDSGEMLLVEPSGDEYLERGRFEQPSRSESRAWPHPVVANGGLYLRDENVLLCFDVSEK